MVLSVKFLLVIFSTATVIPLLRWSSNPSLTRRTHDVAIFSLVSLSRLGIFSTIFVFLKIPPRSDVTVYYREAIAALHGEIPLVGIHTAYGPLFDEIAAITIACWRSPIALVLVAVLLEILSFPIWLRVGRSAFTEMQTRRAAALYAFNPLATSTVAIAGQNHVGISLLLALSLLALLSKREEWSGILLGFSIIAVKFLSFLFAPVLFMAARRRTRWTISVLTFPVAGYGAVIFFGAHPVDQVVFHAYYSSSGNLPFLLTGAGLSLTAPHDRFVIDIIAFILLCAAFTAAIAKLGRPDPRRAILLCAFVLLVTLIVSPKAFASYLIIALFPICLAVACQRRFEFIGFGFLGICGLATLEPSLWFRWMQENQLDLLRLPSLPPDVTRAHLFLFLLCELFLVGGYAWLVTITWRAMKDRERSQYVDETGEDHIGRQAVARRPDGRKDCTF